VHWFVLRMWGRHPGLYLVPLGFIKIEFAGILGLFWPKIEPVGQPIHIQTHISVWGRHPGLYLVPLGFIKIEFAGILGLFWPKIEPVGQPIHIPTHISVCMARTNQCTKWP